MQEAQQRATRVESYASQMHEQVLTPVAEHIKELEAMRQALQKTPRPLGASAPPHVGAYAPPLPAMRQALQKTGQGGIKALKELNSTLRATQSQCRRMPSQLGGSGRPPLALGTAPEGLGAALGTRKRRPRASEATERP